MAVAAALADDVVVAAAAVVVVVVVVLVGGGALGSQPTGPLILPCQLPFCQSEGGHRNSLQK